MAYLNNNGSQYFLFILSLTILVVCCNSRSWTTTTNTHDYKDALTKSILFFEGQRSGKLPPTQQMTWRGDSALNDGQLASPRVNLSGGYYDAGDNVKFTFPMAFTMTMLSWSVIEFGDKMGSDLISAQEAIRWGTDYLIKCASATPGTMFVAVGDPGADHSCWERPEDMDTPRTVYSVTAGSDVAGEVAAALAAASIVFRNVDPRYSDLLLKTAENAMLFALKNKRSCGNAAGGSFYASYGGVYQDELLWGAAWLYRATNLVAYRNYVVSFQDGDTSFFSWDSKYPGANVLLAREYLVGRNDQFKDFPKHAESFMCQTLNYQSTPATYTTGGMLMKLADSPFEYVTSTALLIAVYAKYMRPNNRAFQCGSHSFNSADLQNQAKAQVDYILGTNPIRMSYMVGYGERYPRRIHHRGSSLPSIRNHPTKIGRDEGYQYLYTSRPNPNILTGAVAGGPDWNDNFKDDRSSYSQSEPTTYINAPLVGILASLLP